MKEKDIKYIIGYFDSYGDLKYHVVKMWDSMDSHLQIWPGRVAAHGKWRWDPKVPNKINTYNEDLDFEEEERVWNLVDKLTK